MTPDDFRPDPDALLARVQQDEAAARRGRLKVFVGASPGVGKTYTMLEAARQRLRDGVDVVVGVVETHGRGETAALLRGLEILPRHALAYRGTRLEEFDLDGALARAPALCLVDELAHTNVPGSRHAKRWQDVEELLAAGIDVYTTVNVQHLESLNDVVAQITGIRVRETVPDAVLDAAAEIELVDVSPEVLEERLREGKVYVPEQARRAIDRFFRRPNLVALRGLALRRTAERVDVDLRGQRATAGVAGPWAAAEHLLVLVSPHPRTERLVRAARRVAGRLQARWTALYVEEPGHAMLPAAWREAAQDGLRLAEELGGAAVTVPGHDVVAEALAFARQHNVTRVTVGAPRRAPLGVLPPWSVAARLVQRAVALEVTVVGRETAPPAEPAAGPPARPPRRVRPYLFGAALVVGVSALALPFQAMIAQIDAAMLYLLTVVVVAVRYGRGPTVLAAVLAVAAFDLGFVQPYWQFAVLDARFLFTFAVMFVIALALGGLTTRVREQAEAARQRERRTAALYALSRELASARLRPDLARVALRQLRDLFGGSVALHLPDEHGELVHVAEMPGAEWPEREAGVARWVFDHGAAAGLGTDTLPASTYLYLPLATGQRTLGVVALRPDPPDRFDDVAQRHLVDAMLDLAALALERTDLAEEARRTHLEVEAERLRSSLLSSLSHDLRTPLASVEGAASSLLLEGGRLAPETRAELAQSILDEAGRMTRLVGNLLEMVRVESGALELQRQWHVLEEVVGAALLRVDDRLAGREVTVALPRGLPLVPVDDVLLEQVLLNLLENALRYTPPGSPIEIAAEALPGAVRVSVSDRGPGIPPGQEERIFEKFHRAAVGAGGIGLGLAICRGIIGAHGGRIWAERRPGGGARFLFTLPIVGRPPAPEREADAGGAA